MEGASISVILGVIFKEISFKGFLADWEIDFFCVFIKNLIDKFFFKVIYL